MRLTADQEKAIKTLDKNVIVNAGAGTGKTEVLTRRYVELLKEKVIKNSLSIESIVAITFTLKATHEMKERISERVSSHDFDSKWVQEIENSTINTVHGFFSKILREYSYPVKIDPLFEIIEIQEAESLLQRIVEKVLDDLQKEIEYDKNTLLIDFLHQLGIHHYRDLIDQIIEFYHQLKIYSTPLDEIVKRTKEDLISYENTTKSIYLKELLLEARTIFAKNSTLYKFLASERVESLIHSGANLFEKEDFIDELHQLLKKSTIKNQELIDEIIEPIEIYLLSKEKDYLSYYELFFQRIIGEVDLLYRQEKQNLGVLDFSDLEQLVYQLTADPVVLKQIQEKYLYFMVDEYQDINDIQKEIFYRLTKIKNPLDRQNLFVVGDPKQSIYGFRGANIFVFDETRKDILNTGGEEIVFKDNFRSDENVLSPINEIYRKRMEGRYHPLEAARKKDHPAVFTIFPETAANKEEEGNIMASAIDREISLGIKRAGDYSYLLRARTMQEDVTLGLKEREIPFYIMKARGFYSTGEIYDITNLLLYLYDQKDEISLTGVLNGPYFQLSLEEIREILLLRRGEPHHAGEEPIAALSLLERDVEDFIKISEERGLYSLVLEIFDRYSIFEKLNEGEKSYQKQGNLYKFLNMANESDSKFLDLESFLKEILEMKGSDEQMQIEDEDSDVVKIMTIHESKGLGFKEVFVPGISYMKKPDSSKIKINLDIGVALNLNKANIRYNRLKDLEKSRSIVEDDNVYYVAMTRAKENLYLGLSGNTSGYKKLITESLEELLEKKEILEMTLEEEDREKTEIVREEREKIEDSPLIFNKTPETDTLLPFTISTILQYQNKGIEYILNHFHHKEEEEELEMPAFLKGQIIHSFAQQYREEENISERLLKVMAEYNIEEKHLPLFQEYAQNFVLSLNKKDKYDKIFKEYPFTIKVDNNIFNGIIDRIELSENQCKIIDYKLSKQTEANLLKNYELQLIFYGYVCEKLFQREILLEIQNLENRQSIKVEYHEEKKKEMLDTIKSFIQDL